VAHICFQALGEVAGASIRAAAAAHQRQQACEQPPDHLPTARRGLGIYDQ